MGKKGTGHRASATGEGKGTIVFDLAWDFRYQHRFENLQIDAARTDAKADRARDEVRLLRSQVQVLEQRVDQLLLANTAVWSLVKARLGLTEEELLERVRELDLTDGKVDGKMKQPARKCTGCSRVVAAHRARCIYCGAEPEPSEVVSGA